MKQGGKSLFSRIMDRLGRRSAQRRSRELEPFHRELERLTASLEEARRSSGRWPAGHFYSPLPSESEVQAGLAQAHKRMEFGGIDLRVEAQRALLEQLALEYPRIQLPGSPDPDFRFYLDNESYGHYDAVLFACMVLHFKPERIIEVGSGMSSALMLDLNQRHFDGRISLTMIEPHPEQLFARLRPGDINRATVIEHKVQDAPLELFRTLAANDILFIDSSHVSKVGSDVNHLFFEVLPLLAPGVLVHIHDITGNLEYPEEWYAEGRAWNELYLLRAFLMHNSAYEVLVLSPQLRGLNMEFITQHMPLCLHGGGGQMWLRRKT
jgi:hypothetical protein